MRHLAAAAGILAALPCAAGAGEFEAGIVGNFNLGVGVGDVEGASDSFGLFRDGEIHVRAKTVADNGLTFAARVEIEAFTSTDQIDENWASVSGAFGNILIGGADSALNEHGGVGVVYPSGDYLNYYDGTAFIVPGDPRGMVGKNDSIGVRYWLDLAGFEIGASYQPSATTDGGLDANNPVFRTNEQYALGARYDGSLGDVSFALGGGYLSGDDVDMAHAGVELGYGGVTVAGFYDREERDPAAGTAIGDELNRFGVGGVYRTGPWSVGAGYARTDRLNGRGDDDFVHVGAGYDLAPGITAFGAAQWGENERDVEGYGVFSWLNLRF